MTQPARRLGYSFVLAAALAAAPLLVGTAQAQTAYRQPASAEPKYAAIVVDATSGEVLYAKRADSPRYPASITKVMTMYLAFEALSEGRIKSTDMITVSARAASMPPTKLGVAAGDSLSVDDAMRSLATKSANDMAVALAEHLAGSQEQFAALMTMKAQELGMSNTRFVNASGLPDSRQLTTARDIALLSQAVMRDYPQYYYFFNIRSFTFRGQTMNNHNALLNQMAGVDGLKTGYTNASGYNLAASAVKDNRRIITVVLGGTSNAQRNANVRDLMTVGFDVMRRRDMGEKIVLAQNMFELDQKPFSTGGTQYARADTDTARPYRPAASGRVQAVAVASRDDDDNDIALTSGPARTQPLAIERSMPKPAAATAAAKKKADKGEWTVQAGAYKSKDQARTEMAQIKKRFSSVLSDASGSIGTPVSGYYRVRFAGLSAADAKDACKTLSAKKQACMVVAPGR